MRLAFIGTGWVTGQHISAIHGMAGIDIVAVAGRDQAKAAALATPVGAAAFADWREMLRTARPDGVYLCLAPHIAGEVAAACAGAVAGVLVEKPVSCDLPAAEQAARAFAAAGTIAGAAYHNRARAMTQRIRSLCAQSAPVVADAWWHGDMPGPSWWRTRSQSGGQMTEQCTHLIDLLRFWLGPAASVGAFAASGTMVREVPDFTVDDAVVAALRFPSGAVATIHTSCIAKPGQGRDGVGIVLRARGWEAHLDGWGLEARIITAGGGEEVIASEPEVFRKQAECFRRAVEARDASLLACTYAEGVETLRLTTAIQAAAASGRMVVP
jgi:predicted dehydrogenase